MQIIGQNFAGVQGIPADPFVCYCCGQMQLFFINCFEMVFIYLFSFLFSKFCFGKGACPFISGKQKFSTLRGLGRKFSYESFVELFITLRGCTFRLFSLNFRERKTSLCPVGEFPYIMYNSHTLAVQMQSGSQPPLQLFS